MDWKPKTPSRDEWGPEIPTGWETPDPLENGKTAALAKRGKNTPKIPQFLFFVYFGCIFAYFESCYVFVSCRGPSLSQPTGRYALWPQECHGRGIPVVLGGSSASGNTTTLAACFSRVDKRGIVRGVCDVALAPRDFPYQTPSLGYHCSHIHHRFLFVGPNFLFKYRCHCLFYSRSLLLFVFLALPFFSP